MDWFNNFHISMAYHPLFFIVGAIAILLYTTFVYRVTIPKISTFQRSILIFLRTLALFLILFIIFNPVLKLTSKEKIEHKNFVFIDNSKSIAMFSSKDEKENLKIFLIQLENNSETENNFYTFGNSVNEIENRKLDSLSFNESSTEFASIIDRLKKENKISSVVIISDGILNEGIDVQNEFINFNFPVFTLGLGDTSTNSDLSIEQIKTNEFVYADRETEVEVILNNQNFGNKKTTVSLFEENKLIETKSLTLNESGLNRVTFNYKNPKEGKYKLTLKASTNAKEDNLKNNSKSAIINILASQKKIVIYGGSPSRDLSTIYQTLKENEEFEVLQIVEINQNRTYNNSSLNKIDEADVLLLVGYPSQKNNSKKLNEIIRIINSKKKPFLLSFSNNIDFNKLQVLENILPFRIKNISDNFSESTVNIGLSNSNILGSDQAILTEWSKLPPINITNTRLNLIAGTEVLLENPVNPIIIQNSTLGSKNIIITATNIWKWKLNNKNQPLFKNFLNNAIKWLSVNSEEKQFNVKTEKDNYNIGESVLFTASRYNEMLEPINDETIKLTIKYSDKDELTYFNSLGNGNYEAKFMLNKPGKYQYTAELPNNKNIKPKRGTFYIEPTELESINNKMSSNFLKAISTSTNGEYLDLKNSGSLINKLNEIYKEKVYYKTFENELRFISLKTILTIIVLLFAIEWLIRKRLKMI